MERIILSSADRIERGENHLVSLILSGGERYESLEPRRLFPISRSDEYITLLDQNGDEVAVIRSLRDMDLTSREVIARSLADYYLVPEILKIYSVSERYGNLHWIVETDRGRKEFDIRNRNHDVKVSRNGYVRLRDSDDNRYVIADYRALDKHSRAQLIADM